MARHVIEFKQQCKTCKGTGLYSGMGEGDGCAVVCHVCGGEGGHHVKIEYDDFEGRKIRPGIKHVYEINPGIKVGKSDKYEFSDFGGMPYEDWLAGKPFVPGMENRLCTCPAWWYQGVNSEKNPDWKECRDMLGRPFSSCPHFKNKAACWARWDEENAE